MGTEKNDIKELFLDLVAIDSPSGHEKEIAEFVAKKLTKMKVENTIDEHGNIVAFVGGTGEALLLCAHMDTVEPGRGIKAVIHGDTIETDKKTILGADDKAGIAEIICAVAQLKEKNLMHRPLEIVFTCQEEVGLLGSQKLNKKYITAKEGLIIDRSGPAQVVVIASPFISRIDIEIDGKAAHASNPELGISAIKMAADAISKLKVGRIDEETTNNIGTITGGRIRNGVPERVFLEAEVRSHSKEKNEKQIKKIKKEFENVICEHGGKMEFLSKLSCQGYKHNLSNPLIKKIQTTWQEMGQTPIFEKAGGASDANEFAAWGINVTDIGYGGINPHTKDEQIKISDMQLIADFIVNFVKI
ncbi:MAG: M20/M25/M40 family metallo-hydrolase [bacterium]